MHGRVLRGLNPLSGRYFPWRSHGRLVTIEELKTAAGEIGL
jgi:hypothetical protein